MSSKLIERWCEPEAELVDKKNDLIRFQRRDIDLAFYRHSVFQTRYASSSYADGQILDCGRHSGKSHTMLPDLCKLICILRASATRSPDLSKNWRVYRGMGMFKSHHEWRLPCGQKKRII